MYEGVWMHWFCFLCVTFICLLYPYTDAAAAASLGTTSHLVRVQMQALIGDWLVG